MKPLPGTKNLPRTKEAIRHADLHLYGSKLNGPGLSAGRRNPYPTKAKKEKQTSLIRRGYLLAPQSGDRARRPSVQNLYMAAKIKLKLFEGSSLRLFTKQTTGTPPSFPANITKLLHEELSDEQQNKAKVLGIYPTENFNEDMLRLN